MSMVDGFAPGVSSLGTPLSVLPMFCNFEDDQQGSTPDLLFSSNPSPIGRLHMKQFNILSTIPSLGPFGVACFFYVLKVFDKNHPIKLGVKLLVLEALLAKAQI